MLSFMIHYYGDPELVARGEAEEAGDGESSPIVSVFQWVCGSLVAAGMAAAALVTWALTSRSLARREPLLPVSVNHNRLLSTKSRGGSRSIL